MTTFDEINHATGFAAGFKFTSEQQVRNYFAVESLELMFGFANLVQHKDLLDHYADTVIANRWHMADDQEAE